MQALMQAESESADAETEDSAEEDSFAEMEIGDLIDKVAQDKRGDFVNELQALMDKYRVSI